jgi:hypothetical protein
MLSSREKRVLDVIGNVILIAFIFLAMAAFVFCIVVSTGCGEFPCDPLPLTEIHPTIVVDAPIGQIKYEASR